MRDFPTRPERLPGCLLVLLFATFASHAFAALGDPKYVAFTPSAGALELVSRSSAAPLVVDPTEWPGVTRAVRDLQADLARVTGRKPRVVHPDSNRAPVAVIVGTIGRSALIDQLVRSGKLEVSPVRGQWESWVREVVEQPLPGIGRALVIAGSDKRGTIYGIYDLSEQIGVSPWYWWADVTPEHHDAVYVDASRFVQGPPTVKYRGIFLNDEAPDLTNWVRDRYGDAPVRPRPPVPAGVANYGRKFYARIFEVLLRLRGNFLWPAMWNNAFNEDDPENARLADEYGIVMGTSHQEPMLRAQKEWDRRYEQTIGPWNYATRPDLLEQFWRQGIARNRNFESIITLGLRGANDTEMAPGGPAANRALLEKIVARQRGILREAMGPDLARIPQLWCLYKEVQDYYEAGMRVPDDVTLLWADDNWGNLRRLPTARERVRSGGAGVYYHFDYHGGPRSYQWINTNPLPKIWEQMSLAHRHGADRIWIVNVGHFKGYEVPTEFFLNLAWNPTRWSGDTTGEFLRAWAIREFGPGHAAEIADLVAKYAKYNGRRKPELLSPATYSLGNYQEAERVVAEFDAVRDAAEHLSDRLPPAARDAFYELVLFPTKASALVNELYLAAARNELYAAQGRASAASYAAETRALFRADLALMDHFNHAFAAGRWNHFMDQPHLGYTTWRDPPQNSLAAVKLVEPAVPASGGLGVAIEGATASWPGSSAEARLPEFDSINQQRRWIEVFNRGAAPVEFHVTCSAPWVRVDGAQGTLGPDRRLWVAIDWAAAPAGLADARIEIGGGGTSTTVHLAARKVGGLTREELDGFVENAGVVSIEPEHYTRNLVGTSVHWVRVADYGRTLSGMRAEPLAWTPGAGTVGGVPPSGDRPRDAALLEYRFYAFAGGPIDVTAITSPTLNFVPDRGLRYAVSIDNEPPQTVTLVPENYQAQNGNADWEKAVADNARYSTSHHGTAAPGYHILKVWAVDPAVVLQKLVINLGGLKPSYLGPPESFHRSP
jgi:hypothetical protein